MKIQYELGIIGGGPAGYHAALEAARCGMSVVLFEQRKPGGVCLFDGCIPTKSLVTGTKAYYHVLKNAAIKANDFSFDWQAAKSKKEKDVKKLAAGLAMQLKHKEIPIVQAFAKIKDATEEGVIIAAGEEEIAVSYAMIATGSKNIIPPIEGLQEAYMAGKAVDSTGMLMQCTPIGKLVVIGAGVIGLELASIYANVGTEVVILEREDYFLPGLDDGVKAEYIQSLKRKGIQLLLQQEVVRVIDGETLQVQSKAKDTDEIKTFTADQILVAAGRRGCVEDIGLEDGAFDVVVEGGHIVTNGHHRTGNPRIFACGDVADKSMLAYTAGMEGEEVVRYLHECKEGILHFATTHHQKEGNVIDFAVSTEPTQAYAPIPAVVFSNPEAAFVGMTEVMCKREEIAYQTTSCSMNYSSLFAIENERENGVCKLIYADDGTLLGCHMIGNGASEVIGTLQAYIAERKTIQEIAKMPIMHPSKLEVVKEAINLIL